MITDRVDQAIELIIKARKDKKTFALAVGSLVALSLAVGAISIYERMMAELEDSDSNEIPVFNNEDDLYLDEQDY